MAATVATTFTGVTDQTVEDLRNAARDCAERGLIVASKWASELLLSTSPSKQFPLSNSGSQSIPNSELELREAHLLTCARSFFSAHEFQRAVHLLRACVSPKARFISVYCQFLASEKTAIHDWHKLDNNRHQPPLPINTSLVDLLALVQNTTDDPWLLFLKALFLSRLSRRKEAIECTILSIAKYPWNWSTWTLLASCLGDGDELAAIIPLLPLPTSHPLVQMLQIKTLNELHNSSENELGFCNKLLTDNFFPSSVWIMALRACVLYHLPDFAEAEAQFERILAIDPYRIDDIDIYSNILYVTGNQLKLSRLAHEFLAVDKDRPEVCCLVGNHYSMRDERTKAIKYFKRATELDRTYLSAWTLMGHEFVELKNSHAAIEAYRRAVDANRKDYRAWHGLGQAYELLDMPQYALHYYQHATALRPYDVRLWQALGLCYETLGQPHKAIECLKRALIGADPHEIKINVQLAKLHNDLNKISEAAAYHRRVVEVSIADERQIQDFSRSCLYVADYHMTTPGGDLLLARDYIERVATSNSSDVQEASEMIKKVQAMFQARAATDAASAAIVED